MNEETWLDIPGFEGICQASNLGRIRTLDRLKICKDGRRMRLKGKIKKSRLSNGYPTVNLRDRDGVERHLYVHRLVMMTFSGECHPDLEVCHFDGDRTNSRYGNLRWDTTAANAKDKLRHGTQPLGERCHTAKLTESDVLYIMKREKSSSALAKEFGVTKGAIKHIWAGRNWSHVTGARAA